MKRILDTITRPVFAALALLVYAAGAVAGVFQPDAALSGLLLGFGLVQVQYPTIEDFAAEKVGLSGKIELIWQPLYDWQIYPTAGIAQLPFFTVPQGGGFSSQPIAAAAPKTEADTILTQPGQLPAPQSFWADGLEIQIDAGSTATANLYGVAVPSVWLATAAAASTTNLNDVNIISRSGLVKFNIMQKTYYQESPIYRFPPRANVKYAGNQAVCGTNAQPGSLSTMQALSEGNGVRFVPGYGIATSSNFSVVLSWPALVPTTAPGSGFNARIGCFLNGWLFRAAQ